MSLVLGVAYKRVGLGSDPQSRPRMVEAGSFSPPPKAASLRFFIRLHFSPAGNFLRCVYELSAGLKT